MVEKMLVCVDDSEESWRAFDYAVEEAKKKGIDRIYAVHHTVRGAEEIEEYRTGKEIMEEAESRVAQEGVEVETKLLATGQPVMVRGYKPAQDIIEYAEENDFEHIIVGHRGRSGLGRALLGSVAQKIVEKAHCPVTVVREIC